MFFSRKSNEVRHRLILLLFVPFVFVFVLGITLYAIWPVIISIVISIMIYVNCKLVFDDSGITFYNIWGHKYQVLWEDVLLVEDTYEDPRRTRGAPGKIVKIVYKNHKQKVAIAKYSYITSVGLPELLSFYYAKKSQ